MIAIVAAMVRTLIVQTDDIKISWLHLTDLHVGQPGAWLWPQMRHHFLEDVKLLLGSSDLGKLDVVLFSGDLVQSGTKQQFDEFNHELDRLWDLFAADGHRPILLTVPGNHDLERPEETSRFAITSRHWYDEAEEPVRRAFWQKANFWMRKDLEKILVNYRRWLGGHKLPQPLIHRGLLPGDFSTTLRKGNFTIGIVGLNSTFLQVTKANYEQALDLHVLQLNKVCGGDPPKWRSQHDLTILMTHQPPKWLHPEAAKQLNSIYDSAGFHSHFCGHLHEALFQDSSQGGRPTNRLRQGPSLFGLETYGINVTKRDFGYSAGYWRISGNEGVERIWPRLARISDSNFIQFERNPAFQYAGFDPFIESAFVAKRRVEFEKELQLAATESATDKSAAIVEVDKPISRDRAADKLRNVPRLRLCYESHHISIRETERDQILNILRRERYAWLISDWQFGQDGFLASVLNELGGTEFLDNVFRLQCGGVKSSDELLVAAETQLGMSVPEFLAAVATIPNATLLFDDLPSSIAFGDERGVFERRITEILDFCADLRIIVSHRPFGIANQESIELRALDSLEIQKYLLNHSRIGNSTSELDDFEGIHNWSGGLPVHLDRLVDRLPYIHLHVILNEEERPSAFKGEDAPESLKLAVKQLQCAGTEMARRSFRLLQVLTVLRDGETFESIRKFDKSKPFHQNNIDELIAMGLLENIPIAQTAAELSPSRERALIGTHRSPKLLRIPRQVRDYVRPLISDATRSQIVAESTTLLFGEDWRSGVIKLRTALQNAYGHSAILGPGNEHVVARFLLEEAILKNTRFVRRYADLACSYCHKLLDADRFRDTVIAAAPVFELLKDTRLDEAFVDISHVYARGLRMTGVHAEAIQIVQDALERGREFLIDSNKASMHLTLALLHESENEKEKTLAEAKRVLDLALDESSDAYHARAIIANIELQGAERLARLESLHDEARNRKHDVTANNILLDLARETTDPKQALQKLNYVLRTATDTYSRTRAIVNKARVVSEHGLYSHMSAEERNILSVAYSYSYAQRIGNLLDQCHKVLWTMFSKDGLIASLFRLFRFSSYSWLVRGKASEEGEYLIKLKQIDLVKLQDEVRKSIKVELTYFEKRRRDQEQHHERGDFQKSSEPIW